MLGLHAVRAILLSTILLSLSKCISAISRDQAGKIDWHVPRIGVPWIDSSASSQLLPRFHRLIKPNQHVKDKAQTAIFVATTSNALGAINPRNGALVWRKILEENDHLLSFKQNADLALSISGSGGANVRLYHGITGYLLWETAQHRVYEHGMLPESDFLRVDAAFLKTGDVRDDVLTIANARTVRRLDGNFGREVWKWEPVEQNQGKRQLIRVVPSKEKIYVVSLLRTENMYKLSVHTLSHAGQLIGTHEIKSSVSRGPSDVTILPWGQLPNQPPSATPGPWVTWLNMDGSIRATPLDPPSQKLAQPQIINSKRPGASFSAVVDVGLGDRGLVVGKRSDGMGEVIRLNWDANFTSMWEFEEEAYDAIYHGTYDRAGHAYINRVFFSRGQYLLNFHVFWANANNGGEGQVTGMSFQYDHDLHGDVLAAPFEASPVSQFQLVTRAALVTKSGSIRMIQEDQHQWILEEGLTETTAAIMVDLPEKKLTTLQGGAAALDREGFVQRLIRHTVALKDLPKYIVGLAKRFATGSYGAIEQVGLSTVASESSTTATTVAKVGNKPSQEVKPEDKKPSSLAPRIASANTTSTLYTDPFGFRKLIIAATSRGKIYAIDSIRKETYVWEKSLVGYGQGEGEHVPTVEIKLLSLVRPLSSDGRSPIVSIVAQVHLEHDIINTRVYELNPFTGEFINGMQAGQSVFLGSTNDAFLLPVKDADTQQQAIGIVDNAAQLHLYPDTMSVAEAFTPLSESFYFALKQGPEGKQALSGFVAEGGVSTAHASHQVWQLPLTEGEIITSTLSQSKEHIASLGRVLGDRSTLYKYLNPHAQLVTTLVPCAQKAHIYLVDTVTGSVLFEVEVPGVDHSQWLQAIFVENWIVYSYLVRNADEGYSTRMVSIELYEQPGQDQTWTWTGNFSSFTGDSSNPESLTPVSYSQSFLFPYGVRSLSTTTTKFGISHKNLLVATDRETIFSVPRKMLDPRRPLGKPTKAEAEEFLPPYNPVIPPEPKWVVSHIYPLGQIHKIITAPALLESTSLVYAFGLDSFFTRVSPSGQFDILQESFNKPQLLLTIAALSAGIIITRPMVRSRALAARW